MTVSDEGENKFRYVEGPTAFGNALEFTSDLNQCLVHKDFTIVSDKCTTNLTNCEEGLSMSVWYKGYQGVQRDWDYANQDPNDPSVTETIASTGGDTKGHPGIAVYLQGMTLKAVVSTGDEYWLASCVGMLNNDKWTNIAFSWKHDEGLLLYIDTKLEASTMYPTPSPGAKPDLTPPLMHLGCHSDATNTDYRYFLDGAVDELAIWDKALRGTDAALFLGDHIRAFAEVSVEELSSIVDESDISDPDVMAAALLITAQSTYSEEVPEGELTASTTAATTTTTTNSDASTTNSGSGSTTTTMQPESDAYKKFKSVMKLFKKFSGTTLKDVDIMSLDKTLALVDVTSNIFVQKHKEFLMGADVGEDTDGEATMAVNANQIMEDLANWTMRVMQNTDFGNRTEMFSLVKETENLIVHVFKGPQSALHTTNNGFVMAPNCKIMSEKPSWNNTCNRAAVPSAVVTNRKCENRIMNVVITSSRNVHKFSHTQAVGGAMDSYLPHELNSMVLSVKMTPDPVLDKEGNVDKRAPHCNPDPKALHQTPLRLKLFELMTHSHQSRKLSFHEEAPVKRVLSQHCAWWDADMRQWDGTDCVVMEHTDSYTKCACARFGSFVVLNELIEPRVVPDEHLWLLVLRYVGYTLSILLIIIYIIVVAVSRDLKDQFHLMGLNLAVAVLVGAVAMVVSDLEAVRDDRHWCTAIGTIIQLFYQAAGAWILLLGHAAFSAITSGVIGGRLKCYLPISWGLPFISVGLNYVLFMLDLGEDPRCFISWENPPKFVFFGFQLLFVAVACFCACVVLCNMATTALRKDNLIDDYGSFCNGAAFLMLFFSTTWIFGFFCYIRLSRSSLDFYPIFQVLNSWTGVVLFLFIGLASRRFRMVVAGQAKLRREMLKGYAFGKTGEAKGNRPTLAGGGGGGGAGAGAGPSTFFNPFQKTAKPKNNQGTKGKLPPVRKRNAPGRAPLRTFTAD